MTTLVDRGYRLLNRATSPAARVEVRYLRGSVVVNEGISATISRSEMAQVVDGEITAADRSFRWSLKADELELGGERLTPHRGDTVEWRLDGMVYSFELLPANGELEAGAFDPRRAWIPFTANLIDTHTDE